MNKLGPVLAIAGVVALSAILIIDSRSAQAAFTATLAPDGDVTRGWTGVTGCTSTTHYDCVNETTNNTADYISTGTTGSTGEIEEFTMTTAASSGVVISDIFVTVWAHTAACNGNAPNCDSISINVRIGGTLQTAKTFTLTTTNSPYYATFSGSWSSDSDLQVQVTRTRVGGGNSANADDNVQLTHVSSSIAYTKTTTFNQSSYRWFNNTDATSASTFLKSEAVGDSSTANDRVNDVVVAADGSIYTTGYTKAFNDSGGWGDLYVAKYNSSGNIIWFKTWGPSSGDDEGFAIALASDGSIYVTGATMVSSLNRDMVLNKFSSSGNLVWSKTWSGSSASDTDYGFDVEVSSDGSVYVTGATSMRDTTNHIYDDMFINKYNSSGTLTWNRMWGGSTTTSTEEGKALSIASDGSIYIAADYSGGSSTDFALVKYNSSGTIQWSRTWGGTSNDDAIDIKLDISGNPVALVETRSYGTGSSDFAVIKYDTSGNFVSDYTWGGTSTDSPGALYIDSSDNIYMTGSTQSFGAATTDLVVIKYDSTGSLLWNKMWGGAGSGIDAGSGIVVDGTGNVIVGGSVDPSGADSSDNLLAKFSSGGQIAGCTTDCTSPSATETDPSATTGTPAVVTSTPSGTVTTPTLGAVFTNSTQTTVFSETSIDVGSPLAAQDTSAVAPSEGTPFRLRMNIHLASGGLTPGDQDFKLQYSVRGSDDSCDTIFLFEAYSDVSTSSGVIRFYDNTNAGDGQSLSTNGNDPTHSTDTLIRQSYEESNNFTTSSSVSSGEDGMWDFSLVEQGAPSSTAYCFRAVKSDGSTFTTYSVVPQITTASATYNQSNWRWYENDVPTEEPTGIRALGSIYDDSGSAISTDSQGNTYIGGVETAAGGMFNTVGFLAKFNSSGGLLWKKNLGPSLANIQDIKVASSGNIYVAGNIYLTSGFDTLIAKFDSSGSLLWNKAWGDGSTEVDTGTGLAILSDESVFVTGTTASYGSGGGDPNIYLARYNSSGSLQWTRTWSLGVEEYGGAITYGSDGYLYVTGNLGIASQNVAIMKFDTSGTLIWDRTWSGASVEYGRDITVNADGSIYVTGSTTSFSASEDMYLSKYDSSGNLTWNRTWGGTGADAGFGVTSIADGSIFVTGSTASFGAGSTDMFLAKYDSSGNLTWNRTWGGTGAEEGQSVMVSSGDYINITGTTASSGVGGNEILWVKYDSSGAIANCLIANCQTPSATVNTPSATHTDPAGSTTSPSATSSDFTEDFDDSTATTTIILGTLPIVGTPKAAQNTIYSMAAQGELLRLRMLIGVTGKSLSNSGQSFKMQYAPRFGTCDTSFTGETYTDLTTGGTSLTYFTNSSASDGSAFLSDANDPTSSNNIVYQTYEQNNNFTNSLSDITAGEDGMWDFTVTTGGVSSGGGYCFRVVKSDGTPLDSYGTLPELWIPASQDRNLRHGRFFSEGQESDRLFYW